MNACIHACLHDTHNTHRGTYTYTQTDKHYIHTYMYVRNCPVLPSQGVFHIILGADAEVT